MARERLMAKQRARALEARKKRKAAQTKTTNSGSKTPSKVTGVGPVKSGAEYGRNLQKERQAKSPQPKAEVKTKATPTTTTKPKQVTKSEAESRFFRSSSGTRGQNLPSNPQLKSKPKRSDFPAGRGGQAKYAAALRNYNKKPAKPRRAALTMEQRRRARRSSNRR